MGFIQRAQRDLAICRRNGLILPVVAALVQQRRQDGQQFLALKHTQRHWLRVMENRGGDNFGAGVAGKMASSPASPLSSSASAVPVRR